MTSFSEKIGPEREVGGSSLTNQFRKVVFDGLSMSLGSMEAYLIFVTGATGGARVNFFWPV